MNAVVLHIQDALEVRHRTAVAILLIGIEATAILVAFATRSGLLLQAAGLAILFVILLIGISRPLLPLFGLVAIIPIEEVLRVDEIGTLSKVLGLLFAVVYAVPRIRRLKVGAMPAAGWAFIGWAVLSVTWAIEPSVSLQEIPTMIQLFAVAVLIADVIVADPSRTRAIMWTYSISAALTALVGIDSYITGSALDPTRVTAFAGQDAAQFALILLPALVFTLHELSAGRAVPFSGTIALLTGIAIILSGTRGAWLGVAVMVVFFLIPGLTPRRRVVTMVAVALTLLVALQLPGVSDLIDRRTGSALPTGGAGRTDIWTVGATIFQSTPLVGVGLSNFPVAYTPERVRAAAVANYTDPAYGSHSIIVGTISEFGLIGIVLLVGFLGPLVLRRGWGPDAVMIQATLASILTAALFLDVLNRKQVWLVIGIAAGLGYLRARRPPAPIEDLTLVPVASPATGRNQPSDDPAG